MQYILKRWCSFVATAWRVAGMTMIAIVLAITVSSPAFCGGNITLNLKNAKLRDVISSLMIQSGANVVIQDNLMLDKTVTASLNNVTLDKAMDCIVKSAGISYTKDEDGTYIIGGIAGERSVISRDELAEVLPALEMPVTTAPAEEITFAKIQVVHMQPSVIMRMTGWDGENPIPNADARYPKMKEPGEKSNSKKGNFYMQNSNNGTLSKPSNIQYIDNQPVIPTIDPVSLDSSAGRTADWSTGAGQFEFGSGSRRGGNFVTGQQAGRPVTGTQPQAATTSRSGGENFLWPEGVSDAKPFDLDNSIIVKGTEDGIEKFKKIIRMLDVPPKQVQIKAEFVEVKTTDIKKFGIDWSLERLNDSFATVFEPQGNVVAAFASGNLTANLRAQLTSEIGTIINSPIISTINNQNAQISIQTQIPYWTSYAVSVGDNVVTESTPDWLDVQTQLDVLPRVNGDGTITMILRPGVSDTGIIYTGPDGTEIPEQRTQELFTQRRVANGETIVVGGFIRKNDSRSTKKVPILGDLPIVGSLFRTTSNTNEDSELLIFVTATIIPDSSGGTVGDIPIL